MSKPNFLPPHPNKSNMDAEKSAHIQLEQILEPSRPKNVAEGVSIGVSNIVAGAVGAIGVAIVVPTLGLVAGTRQGGVIGGVVGLTGGAIVGVVGAAAFAVGGAVSGVSQIVRGVVNTPEALRAPREGKWWNELEGKWVKTSIPDDYARVVEGIPEDDSDLIGDVETELEESALATGEVKETYYYDVLEVGPSADASAIKRRYYILARKYHPDKVEKDDIESQEKFKAIAEAYQVLADPELRRRYDREGRSGLSPDKTSVATDAPKLDPTILFAFLFGSDKFYNYIGRLSTATSAMVGDSPKISVETGRSIQRRRVTRLAKVLAEKLQPWIQREYEFCHALWKTEAAELAKASYGIELVHLIGKVYNLSAVQFLGSLESGMGMPSIGKWAASQKAKLDSKAEKSKNKMETIRAGLGMVSLQKQFGQDMAQATTDEEKAAVSSQMKDAMATSILRIMWTTTVVDITNTLYETIQMVLFDQSVDKGTREQRARGLKILGEIFMETLETTTGTQKDAKAIYEEAAFAAMLETIKRKEEANRKASGH